MILKIKNKMYDMRFFALFAAALVIAVLCTVSALAASNLNTVTIKNGILPSYTVSTADADAQKLLSSEGITLGASDSCTFTQTGEYEYSLVVDRACDVLIEDGEDKAIWHVSGTVGDALEAAGIKLGEHDSVSVDPGTPIQTNMRVFVTRAFRVSLVCDGKTTKHYVCGGTVADLIKDSGTKLSKTDKVSPAKDAELEKGMKVVVTRIKYVTRSEVEKIAFKTVEKKSGDMFIGQTEVVTAGLDGSKTNYYKQKYVNGKLRGEELTKSVVTKKPVDRVIKVGTKVVPTTAAPSYSTPAAGAKATAVSTISQLTPPAPIELDANGRPKHYKQCLVGPATAYSTGSYTATGQRTIPGRVAVDPKEIPYGSKLYIITSDGKTVYGYAEASDTGTFIYTTDVLVDLFMPSYSAACNWGRRTVEVYVLE